MKQSKGPAKPQLSMDLQLEVSDDLTGVDQDALIAALTDLLLEAYGQEQTVDDPEMHHER